MGLNATGSRFDEVSIRLIRVVTGLLLVVMFVVIVFGVVLRYVFNSPAFWTEELARYVMFYMVLIGSVAAIRQQRHPALCFLIDRFPRRFRLAWDVVLDGLVFLVLVFVLVEGCIMAVEESIGRTTALRISFFWVYLALPIGALLMMAQIVAKYIWGKKVFDNNVEDSFLSHEVED